MDNESIIQAGADYHWKTAYDRNRMSGHYLDWENQPLPFKKYSGIETHAFPPVSQYPEKSLWSLVSGPKAQSGSAALNQDSMARLLYLSGGITAKSRQAGGDFYFRAQASAGALYPTELYAGVVEATDLKPGLYHFSADHFGLSLLRQGAFAHFLAEMGVTADTDRPPTASFFLSGIFFRSAWKYRARAYRYVLLDTGHLLENLVLVLASQELAFTCHYDFEDDKLGRLLGMDDQREVGLVCINVLNGPLTVAEAEPDVNPLPPEILAAGGVSKNEVVYDDMMQMHREGICIPASARKLGSMSSHIGVTATDWALVQNTTADEHELPHAQAVLHRRSKRNYVNRTLEKKTFIRLLDLLCRSHGRSGVDDRFACLAVGFLTGNIDGFDPGFYLLDPENRRFGQVTTGDLIEPMTSVCLDQRWLDNAAVHFLLMANLKVIDDHYGARGYRYAMLNAGRLGQLIYLGATALGLGCCGIGALYDCDAQKLLGLNQDSALLYLVAAGPVKRL